MTFYNGGMCPGASLTVASIRTHLILVPLLIFVACQSVENAEPRVDAVMPSAVSSRGATQVVISGAGFFAHVRNQLNGGPPDLETDFTVRIGGATIPAADVTFVDSNTLTVIVPAGLPTGAYTVGVRVPDGREATLTDGLSVLNDTSGLTLAIETTDGSGPSVRDATLRAGEGLKLTAVFRDAYGTVIDGEPVNWSVDGSIGGLSDTRGVATSLAARRTGEGRVVAMADTGQTATTGAISVGPGAPTRLVVEDLPGGAGAALETVTLTADDAPRLYAISRDAFGNFGS